MGFEDHIQELTDLIESNQLIEVSLVKAGLYAERAYYYRLQGQYDLAEQDSTSASALVPDDANNFFNRAHARRMQGKHELAIMDLTKSIELTDDVDIILKALKLRIGSYEKLKRYDQAFKEINHIIEIQPDDLETRLRRGYRLLNRGRLDETWLEIQHILSIDENYDLAKLLKVKYWLITQEYDKAEELMHSLLKSYRANQAYVDYQKQYWIEARQRQGKDTTPDW